MNKNKTINKILTDRDGVALDREALLERCTLYDVHCLRKGIDNGDFDWVHKIMKLGHMGLDQYSDKQLKREWEEIEDGFFDMLDEANAPYMLEDDPKFIRH